MNVRNFAGSPCVASASSAADASGVCVVGTAEDSTRASSRTRSFSRRSSLLLYTASAVRARAAVRTSPTSSAMLAGRGRVVLLAEMQPRRTSVLAVILALGAVAAPALALRRAAHHVRPHAFASCARLIRYERRHFAVTRGVPERSPRPLSEPLIAA